MAYVILNIGGKLKIALKLLSAAATTVGLVGALAAPSQAQPLPPPPPGLLFSDVNVDTQFYDQIEWASYKGITTGWVDGDQIRTFRPTESISRDAMAAFLYRYAGSPAFSAPSVSPFTDIAPGTQFYKEITWLASTGITTGWVEPDKSRTFRPGGTVTRDAMAAFLYRIKGSPTILQPAVASNFTDVTSNDPFFREISWLLSAAITTGYPGPNYSISFHPDEPVHRDAMAAFLKRLNDLIL